MEEWTKAHVPTHDLDEQEIVAALHHTTNSAIPTVGTSVLSQERLVFQRETENLSTISSYYRKNLNGISLPTCNLQGRSQADPERNSGDPHQLLVRMV